MAFDGNGNWISNFSAVADRDANIKILASRFDNIFIADIAQSFENCLTKDMQVKPQQAFDANSYKVINVANPTNPYDAVNKQTLDTTLSTLYPVGSIYIGTQNTCPLEDMISGSTWELVGEKVILDVDTTATVKGTGISLGLTDGTKLFGVLGGDPGHTLKSRTGCYGAEVGTNGGSSTSTASAAIGLTTDPEKSGIEATVSKTEFVCKIWKRTA